MSPTSSQPAPAARRVRRAEPPTPRTVEARRARQPEGPGWGVQPDGLVASRRAWSAPARRQIHDDADVHQPVAQGRQPGVTAGADVQSPQPSSATPS